MKMKSDSPYKTVRYIQTRQKKFIYEWVPRQVQRDQKLEGDSTNYLSHIFTIHKQAPPQSSLKSIVKYVTPFDLQDQGFQTPSQAQNWEMFNKANKNTIQHR